MQNTKDILLQALLSIERLDDDVDLTQTEVSQTAIEEYEYAEIIDQIGKEDFKETYLNFIDDIKLRRFEDQRRLCYFILHKIKTIHGFEYPERIRIFDSDDIQNIYQFVEFIEFDNVELFINLFSQLEIDFISKDVDVYFDENKDFIIGHLGSYIQHFPLIFKNLYVTLKWDILLKILKYMCKKNKNLITIESKIRRIQWITQK